MGDQQAAPNRPDEGDWAAVRRPARDVFTVDLPFTARVMLIDPDLDLTDAEKDHLVTVMRG